MSYYPAGAAETEMQEEVMVQDIVRQVTGGPPSLFSKRNLLIAAAVIGGWFLLKGRKRKRK